MPEWIHVAPATLSGRRRSGIPASRARRLGTLLVLAILILVPAPPAATAARASAAHLPAAPPFAGPAAGAPAVLAPQGTDFSYSCNAHANAELDHAAGAALPVGAALNNVGDCGQALLFLNAPASGHFLGTFAVSDSELAGTKGGVRIFVLGAGGATLRALDLTATRGTPQPVDIDVAGAVTLALRALTSNSTFLYSMHLTGGARARHATPLSGTGPPAGAAPMAASSVTYACNANPAKQDDAVSAITVPMAGAYEMTGCDTSKIAIQLPPHARGTLALRYGTADTTTYSSIPTQVSLRVLDGNNQVLRKAVGLTYLGSGLQPLWVDLKGGSIATLSMDSGNTNASLVFTGISTLAGSYAQHPNPDHVTFGAAGDAPVVIPATGVAGICNASLGTDDVTVAHQNIFGGNYIAITHCGTAEMIMTNTHGTFRGKFGVNDGDSSQKDVTISVVVLDRNSHPLSKSSVTARFGQPAVSFSASIENASILQIHTDSNGSGILFGMTLIGHAVLYDRIFAPSEPPVSTKSGTPIPGAAFDATCNGSSAKEDTLLIHAVALEQWSLAGTSCGAASLDLAKIHGHTFSALYGIPALDQTDAPISHLTLSVFGPAGSSKPVRSRTFVARAGYGPQRLAMDLTGGTRLQISWVDNSMVLFALTAS